MKKMKDLYKYIRDTNRKEYLWSQGDTLLLGVSGGSDSLCLLDLMVRCSTKDELSLIVAHVNYGLRGSDADADEDLVRTFCAKYRIPFHVKRFEKIDQRASEALWREQRYKYFEKLRCDLYVDRILIGHNANDQAETLLLHLLRGSRLNGMCGMRFRRDVIVRPLLGVQKWQVVDYCKERGIIFGEDTTNNDHTFVRNRIRHELLPFLEKDYNKEIIKSLSTMASQISVDYDYIEQMAKKSLPIEMNEKEASFIVDAYKLCHPALQKMRLYQIITTLQKNEINITSRNIAEMDKAIMSTKNKSQIVKMKGLKMERKGDTVKLTIDM